MNTLKFLSNMKVYSSRNAFTLIEVMVSMAVLSVILLVLAQMMATVSQVWSSGVGQFDNFTKSRAMLDLVGSDLQRAIIRPDLPIFQTDGSFIQAGGGFSGGSPSSAFFTQVAGLSTGSVRNVSLVTYKIVTTTDSDKIKLQRSDMAVPWTNSASIIPFQGTLTTPLGSVTAQDMAPGVVGFELAFRRVDGTVTTSYTGYSSTNPVVAVGVTLAVVGNQALNQLSVGQLTNIRDNLTECVANANSLSSVKALWDSNLTSSFYSQYPKSLGPNLQTFERWVVPAQPF